MLQDEYMAVTHAGTPEELLSEIVRFTHQLEFETVSATLFIDHLLEETEVFSVDNAPEAYRSIFDDGQRGRRDPVMQHCKKSSLPIVWGQATYTAQALGEDWEELASYGYCNGISMALHLPDGRHFLLGAERDQPLPDHPGEVLRRMADMQLLTTCAHEAAARIFVPKTEEAEPPILTPCELDSLRWTMEGKTAREVGEILCLNDRTTVMHLNKAMRKLGCGSKHQAVLKAVRLKILR